MGKGLLKIRTGQLRRRGPRHATGLAGQDGVYEFQQQAALQLFHGGTVPQGASPARLFLEIEEFALSLIS